MAAKRIPSSGDIKNDPSMSVLEQMNQDKIGVVWDRGEPNSVKGLHLRIFKSGKRVFYFYYVAKFGIRRRPKIGEGLKLSEARKIAGEMRAKVLLGLDPRQETDAFRNEKTIREVFTSVIETYYDKPRFRESGRLAEVQSIYRRHIERPFASRKLSGLRSPEIRAWHLSMCETPIMANRALEVLARIYSLAVENEWVAENQCTLVKAFSEKKRKRVPTREELEKLISSLFVIAKDPNDRDRFNAIFFIGLFYTGARPMMLEDVKWSHSVLETEAGIKFELRGKMSYKSNEFETVFIPKQVLDLLALYPKRPDGKLFTIKGSRRFWTEHTKGLDIGNLWKRDARKAFASLALKSGVSIDKIGLTLNHRSANTTKIYAQEFDNGTIDTTVAVAQELDNLLEGKL